ncbi:MAG: TssQ family T6SS-associated lipoprotein [Burkholderiales bacterium]|nr:TssQ family T6SS-associated lipoprotein [Burkholderiales bacterium]
MTTKSREIVVRTNSKLAFIFLAALPVLLAACATPSPPPVNYPAPPQSAPPPPASSPATVPSTPTALPVHQASTSPTGDVGAGERALATAIGVYERGEFQSAIRALTPMTTDGSLDPSQLLRALKTLAFAQCSVNQRAACRKSFEQAFRADPTFDLTPAERGHPIWGPEFVRARRAVLGK